MSPVEIACGFSALTVVSMCAWLGYVTPARPIGCAKRQFVWSGWVIVLLAQALAAMWWLARLGAGEAEATWNGCFYGLTHSLMLAMLVYKRDDIFCQHGGAA